jgi:hypothetical protein
LSWQNGSDKGWYLGQKHINYLFLTILDIADYQSLIRIHTGISEEREPKAQLAAG